MIGRTNMTEFAFSGIGINPHYGTPEGRLGSRRRGHIPGGSSSGAAVSVPDGMAHGALGTDTGGSCRIPAAYNGIVGYKPTQRRIPLEGGCRCRSRSTARAAGALGAMLRHARCGAGRRGGRRVRPRPIRGMRLAVPTTLVLDELDDAVAQTFDRALALLSRLGAEIERIEVPEFIDVGLMNTKGGFAAAESYAWHRYLLTSRGDVYDPRVSTRILRGEAITAADYIDLLQARRSLIARANARLAPYDALIMPTTANTPPRIADLADDKAFGAANLRSLRNCTLINMIDGCAISLPAHRAGEVPVGVTLAASGGSDRRIFELAAGLENAIRA